MNCGCCMSASVGQGIVHCSRHSEEHVARLERDRAEVCTALGKFAQPGLSPGENVRELRASIARLVAYAKAQQGLMVCYRINKQPSEKLWKALEDGAAIAAAQEALRD